MVFMYRSFFFLGGSFLLAKGLRAQGPRAERFQGWGLLGCGHDRCYDHTHPSDNGCDDGDECHGDDDDSDGDDDGGGRVVVDDDDDDERMTMTMVMMMMMTMISAITIIVTVIIIIANCSYCSWYSAGFWTSSPRQLPFSTLAVGSTDTTCLSSLQTL